MKLELGFVTDEVSRNIDEAFDWCREREISRFELREGGSSRFPAFTDSEIRSVESTISSGGKITAVSPGSFKCSVDDEAQVREDLGRKLPETIEMAHRFSCPMIITFGFSQYDNEPESNRHLAVKHLAEAAALVAEAGLTLAVENEPWFWVDKMPDTVAMLQEIDNPSLRVNWDPANLHWGGTVPTESDYETIKPYIANIHVKDFISTDPDVPWRPVGEGETPWAEILGWLDDSLPIEHLTLETHIQPGIEMSERTLRSMRSLMEATQVK